MQIWAEPEKAALPICNYSQILYQFLTFTQNLKRSHISSQYLLKIIASDTIQDYFKSSLKGIGVPNLHLEHIRTTLIPIPPINEQNKIAERIYQYYSLLDSIVQNIE